MRWKYQRSVPQLPSPLLYEGVLYMVNDNGIITTLNPETGALIKQGRLTGALGPHFASPVAADGHIFFTTEAGAVVVVAPGGDFMPLAINELGEDSYATPAFADGRIYVRTSAALYAFGARRTLPRLPRLPKSQARFTIAGHSNLPGSSNAPPRMLAILAMLAMLAMNRRH